VDRCQSWREGKLQTASALNQSRAVHLIGLNLPVPHPLALNALGWAYGMSIGRGLWNGMWWPDGGLGWVTICPRRHWDDVAGLSRSSGLSTPGQHIFPMEMRHRRIWPMLPSLWRRHALEAEIGVWTRIHPCCNSILPSVHQNSMWPVEF
jgi:hypothetical protein